MEGPAQLESRTTELLQRLIRFNTVNPPGNEQAAQEFLRDILAAAGFECELLSAVEGRPNLIARLRGARRAHAVPLRPRRHGSRRRRRLERRPVVGRDQGRLRLGPRGAGHEEPGRRGGRGGRVPRGLGVAARRGPARRGHRGRGGRRRAWRAVALPRAPGQGPVRLHDQRGRRRDPPLRRPPRLRRLRGGEGRLPVHAHHGGPRRPRLDPADRRQRADEARPAPPGDARQPALARAEPRARIAAAGARHRPLGSRGGGP